MTVSIVAARSLNNVIGRGSEIPWRVKGEQKLFKNITMGGVLVMGRKTFESIGRPLPGRETIIVSRAGFEADGCSTAANLDDALLLARASGKPVYIAGGGEIYRQAMDIVDGVHITTIQTTVEGDVYFPEFPTRDFRLAEEIRFESNIDYIYQYYERDNGSLEKKGESP